LQDKNDETSVEVYNILSSKTEKINLSQIELIIVDKADDKLLNKTTILNTVKKAKQTIASKKAKLKQYSKKHLHIFGIIECGYNINYASKKKDIVNDLMQVYSNFLFLEEQGKTAIITNNFKTLCNIKASEKISNNLAKAKTGWQYILTPFIEDSKSQLYRELEKQKDDQILCNEIKNIINDLESIYTEIESATDTSFTNNWPALLLPAPSFINYINVDL
jgi:hypothetical protein